MSAGMASRSLAAAAAGRSARAARGRRGRRGCDGRTCVNMASAPGATQAAVPSRFSSVMPQGNKVLLRLNEVQDKTIGGILLPSSEQKKPTLGEVVAVGPECNRSAGDGASVVEKGMQVLYSKWGFMTQEVTMDGDTMVLVKEEDLLGTFPEANATVEDVPRMTPLNDRVLLKVDKKKEATAGGVLLTRTSETMKERPVAATVVVAGPGRYEKGEDEDEGDRKFVKTNVAAGDRVVYFRWAGDALELRSGDTYVIIPERDILGRVAVQK